MAIRTPIGDLINSRMHELGLHREAVGFRLGYKNPLRAAGRVHALCDGHLTSAKSQRALARLPGALEVAPEVVERAVAQTEGLLAEVQRQQEEERRIAREKEDAEWRAAFRPHAVLQTENTVPSQITICGLTGGARRWLQVDLDVSQRSPSFIKSWTLYQRRHHSGQMGGGA